MFGKQQCSNDLDFVLALQMSPFYFIWSMIMYNVCPFDLGIPIIPEFYEKFYFFLQDPMAVIQYSAPNLLLWKWIFCFDWMCRKMISAHNVNLSQWDPSAQCCCPLFALWFSRSPNTPIMFDLLKCSFLLE